MSTESLIFYYIDLWKWISKTIAKINPECTKKEWDEAWFKTYKKLGGRSDDSGEKGCPKNAAYCLYKLGRIDGSNISFMSLPYAEINKKLNKGGYGKNALYAIIAIDLLKEDDSLSKTNLWKKVQAVFKQETGINPAKNEAGAVTIAFKLFRNCGLILDNKDS